MDPVTVVFVGVPLALLGLLALHGSSLEPHDEGASYGAGLMERMAAARLMRVAREHGLRADDGLASGRVDGVVVEMYPIDEIRWRLVLRGRVAVPVPDDAKDRGAREDARWLRSDPEVARRLAACDPWRLELEHFALRLEVRGPELAEAVAAGVAVHKALEARLDRSRASVRARWNLSEDQGGERLFGRFRGCSVTVEPPEFRGRGWEARATVQLAHPFPPGTRIVGREHGAGRSQALGDAFLDSALHVTTSDVDAVRARLAREPVVGRLLELLHAGEGSELTSERLVVRWDEGALELEDRLGDVFALVEAMEP